MMLLLTQVVETVSEFVGDICWVREIEFQHNIQAFIEKQGEKKSVFLPAYADDPTTTQRDSETTLGRG